MFLVYLFLQKPFGKKSTCYIILLTTLLWLIIKERWHPVLSKDTKTPDEISCGKIPASMHKTRLKFKVIGYPDVSSSDSSTHPAFRLNANRHHVMISNDSNLCKDDIVKCVTLVIRTRHRYTHVINLIKSARKLYKHLPVIVVDDINVHYSNNQTERLEFISWLKNQSVRETLYIQTLPGVGLGRNIAVRKVKTKYFFLADDDCLFEAGTHVDRLVSVLEMTDVSIVSTYVDHFPYEGIIQVVHQTMKTEIQIHVGVSFETVPCFPQCHIVDMVKNGFLARTEDIVKMGGWNEGRLLMEHEDFLLRVRLAGLKVAICSDTALTHKPAGDYLRKIRQNVAEEYNSLLLKQWNVDDIYFCNSKYNSSMLTCNERIIV